MYKITIIVPMYNMERRIKKCIDSLLIQNVKDLQILVVDDGSTDGSAHIIKEYQRRFPNRIDYIYKENTGIADTRNFAIKEAKGEYIIFVDSDDYIEFDLLQKLEKYMNEGIDLVKYKLRKVDEKRNEIEKINGPVFSKMNGEEAFNTLAFEDVLLDSPCLYMIKRKLLIDNNFKFKEGTEHEDFGLIPLIILKAEKVMSIPFYGYNYVQTEGSITRNEDYQQTLKRFEDALIHYDYMVNYVKHQEINEDTRKNIKTYYTNAIMLKLNELKKEDRKKAEQQIKSRQMQKNIQVHNLKQLLKRVIISINLDLYLKIKG